ncbi:hypothetical protein EDC94DRAFT_651024 [Helicostylum pulchrum]|uniref:Uncharacterized protein n=1 Tax=Helicostylum pulchrum TaxID=562976 RepID=A0ABP9XWA8_9FUNG|nr:hypothetical protein EDC94DRAFT_651024 [Helicostylum pulchrum]
MERNNEEEEDQKELGAPQLLEPFRFENYLGSDDAEGTEYNLVKLLETINQRAANFSRDCRLPKMKLSALYCLGVTIQEYSRYLATDILTEKRATDGLEPLTSLFGQDELNEQTIDSIIEKHKPKDDKHIPAVVENDVPAATTTTSKKLTNGRNPFGPHHKFNVTTSTNPSFYDKMLDSSDWRGVLKKKKRDPEAEEQAAEKRREKNKLLAQRIAEERVLLEERKKQEQSKRMLQNANQYQPQVEQEKPVAKRKIKEEGDIFDTSKKRKTVSTKAKKKKKSANPF